MKKKSILGLIPARGNSKGLPKKNLYPINEKPLIYYTIMASLNSNNITDTYVSSDNDEILEISASFKAKIIKRPAEFATDTSSSHSVIKDALHQLKNMGKTYDLIVLLQPTSPLRDHHDIDKALDIMCTHDCNNVISVYDIGYKPFKSYFMNKNGYLSGIFNDEAPNIRRQDLPIAYMPNGALYIIDTQEFLKHEKLITDKSLPYVMNEKNSYDIDTLDDITQVEKILNDKKQK